MCEAYELVQRLHQEVATEHFQRYYHYARLVLVTNTPFERAVTYLKDTGSPEAAEGRLLLRAAERSLREYGDTPEKEED